MPRKPREDYLGAWQHVMHRGARRAPIFKDDSHCTLFLDLLGDIVDEFEVEIHGYSLMHNHYHLLMRSKHGNLSSCMRRLNAVYTQRVNRFHRWDGPIFRGRFHSQAVRNESHLPYLLAYIHLNPLRANLVTRLEHESWTSHREYLSLDPAHDWLSREHFLELFGSSDELHRYILGLHQGSHGWPVEMTLRTGWFAMKGRQLAAKTLTPKASRFQTPTIVLKQVSEVTGAMHRELKQTIMGPRANPARRFAVWALKRQTLLTHAEIGKLLDMTATQVGNVLTRFKSRTSPLNEWTTEWLERWPSNK
ncbi:MAG: hypothetical protein GY854_10625 [Deltaproteobacteria bacterium]|nr:hypothetical protein [Deltaproteobacteria bacterium]